VGIERKGMEWSRKKWFVVYRSGKEYNKIEEK